MVTTNFALLDANPIHVDVNPCTVVLDAFQVRTSPSPSHAESE